MLGKITNFLFRMLSVLAIITGIILVFAVVLQISSRYVPFINAPWSEEIARFAFIHFTMISIAMTYYKGGHMGIDVITKKLSKTAQDAITCFSTVLILAISIVVLVYGIRLALLVSRQRSPMLNWPYTWFFIAVPFGFFFVAFFAFYNILTKHLLKQCLQKEGA